MLVVAALENEEKMDGVVLTITAEARGRIAVDRVDGFVLTPSIDVLLAYDVVLLCGTHDIHDPVALGDVLDEYVGCGGGVVLAPFTLSDDAGGGLLRGRLVDAPDFPVTNGGDEDGHGGTLAGLPDIGVTRGVVGLIAPHELSHKYYRHKLGLRQGSEATAQWSDGVPLVAEVRSTERPPGRGRVVVLNIGLFGTSRSQPPSRACSRLALNVIQHARRRKSAPATGTRNGWVACVFIGWCTAAQLRLLCAAAMCWMASRATAMKPTCWMQQGCSQI